MTKMEVCRALSDFRLLKKVGQGCIAAVYQAVYRVSGVPVALKVYDKCTLTKITRKQVDREVLIHCSLNHEHIIKLVSLSRNDCTNPWLMSYYALSTSQTRMSIGSHRNARGDMPGRVCLLQYGAFEDEHNVVLIEEFLPRVTS
jgi:serine/threonine protein kinase